jgi:PAS domain S-box-containing protein
MKVEELAARQIRQIASKARGRDALDAPPQSLDKLPLAIYACDRDGRILWFNARAVELWGRTPCTSGAGEKYCGSHKLYLGGRQVAGDESPMALVLRTGIPVRGIEGKLERPDGSSVWARVHIEPVEDEDGTVVGAVNYFHETQKQHPSRDAEPSTPRPDDRLAATYEYAGVGIAEVDGEGRLQRVNTYLADLMGRSPKELLGRSVFDADLADHVDDDLTKFRRQVQGEIERYTTEKRFRREDGTIRWVSVTSSSVRDDAGRFLYAVRVQLDVTDRKRAEEALERRAEEQAAIHEFTEGLQYSVSVEDVCARALGAITRALRCDRASVLLFDDAGIMKFVAARGLSENYQRAVEGHSPWAPDAIDVKPICIEDVEAVELDEHLKHALRAEGLGALAFIPIVSSGQLFGKFMTYYDRPHAFLPEELSLALTIARQLGFAVDRAHVEAERQTAERAAQQLVAIVESSHDAIVSKDLNGVIVTWNQGAESVFGYKADEVIGKPITILIPPERHNEEPAILERIRRGERVDHFDTVRQRKDGTLVDISLTISPVRDRYGRIVGASKIGRDVTDRKAADAKLRDSERQLQELIAAIPAAIYTTDAHGRITYFNQAAVDLTGRTPELGSDAWCVSWKLYRPDGTPLPHDQSPMAIALKEGRVIRNAEAVAERPDGTRVPFIPYPTPLRDGRGNIVGAINMLVDISERKDAETQQRTLFNELNHRVKNNMQMLQSLLYLAGKQARNPETQKVLGEASSRISAMAAAQQVLYGTSNATHFSGAEFLQAVCGTARQTFSRDVNIECEGQEVELSNDAAMPLALILNELLTNAMKHGAQHGGTVRARLTREDNSFLLSVEDDGPGYDLESVRQRSSGLQLVQALARQLRGTFKVTREQGTRCSVQFS